MESIALVIVASVITIIAYTLGLRHSQQIAKGEPISLPILRQYEEKEIDEELVKLNTVINNFENYKGDSSNQKEVK